MRAVSSQSSIGYSSGLKREKSRSGELMSASTSLGSNKIEADPKIVALIDDGIQLLTAC